MEFNQLKKKIEEISKKTKTKTKNILNNIKLKDQDGSCFRFIFGKHYVKKIAILPIYFISFILLEFLFFKLLDNALTIAFIILYVLLTLTKLIIAFTISESISLNNENSRMVASIFSSFFFAEFFILLFIIPQMPNYSISFPKLNLQEIAIPNFLIIFLSSLPLLFAFLFYLKERNDVGQIYGKKRLGSWVFLTMVISIYIAFLISGDITSIREGNTYLSFHNFFLRDLVLLLVIGLQTLANIQMSKKICLDSLDLTSQNKNIDDISNGQRVYLNGEYSRTYILFNTKQFLNFNFQEKLFFFEISCGGYKYNVYVDKMFRNKTTEKSIIFPGDSLEIWGKVLKLNINGNVQNFIYPSKIFNLDKKELKD